MAEYEFDSCTSLYSIQTLYDDDEESLIVSARKTLHAVKTGMLTVSGHKLMMGKPFYICHIKAIERIWADQNLASRVELKIPDENGHRAIVARQVNSVAAVVHDLRSLRLEMKEEECSNYPHLLVELEVLLTELVHRLNVGRSAWIVRRRARRIQLAAELRERQQLEENIVVTGFIIILMQNSACVCQH